MFQICLFAISLFISFALSCNLPNVIYYSTSYKHSIPLFNDNYIPIGYYNKINNNRVYNNKYVLLFDVKIFYYYFLFYIMYFIYRLTTIMLSKLLVEHSKYNKTNFLHSIIRKKTNINMNDTYYIPISKDDGGEGEGDGTSYSEGEGEGDGTSYSEGEGEGEGDGTSCGEDCEECWETRRTCVEGEDDGDGGSSGGEGDGSSGSSDGEGSSGDGGCRDCCECNDVNCTYFSIDNKCKIKCIKCINCEQ